MTDPGPAHRVPTTSARLRTGGRRPVVLGLVGLLAAASVVVTGVATGLPSASAATGGELVVHQQFLDFGLHDVGVAAPPQVVTLENAGTAAVSSLAVAAPAAPFGRTTTCTATLAAGATCTVTYTFTAVTGGVVTGSSAVSSDAGSATVALTGAGLADEFPVVVSPVATDFGTVPVGATSAPQEVTVTNTSSATVNVQVAGGGVGGDDFTAGTTCGGTFVTLAAGASCHIDYAFTPTTTGPRDASTTLQLTLYSDDAVPLPVGTARNVPLSFTGTGLFGFAVTPDELDFGSVPVGAESPAQQVQVVNTTGSTLRVQVAGGGTSSADFSAGTSCGGTFVTLAAGASCHVDYAFRPTGTGPLSATTTLQLTPYDGNGQPLPAVRNFPLTFVGTGFLGVVVTPTTTDFGDRVVGDSSPTEQVRVVNTTASTLRVQVAGGGTGSADFSAGTSCGGTFVTLAAGASCSVTYGFRPTTTGPAAADTTLQLTPYDEGGQPLPAATTDVPIALRGHGVADAAAAFPVVVLSERLDFGSTPVGGASAAQRVRVVNGSSATVNVQVAGGGPSSGDFTAGTACGGTYVTLAAGASCYVEYAFAPRTVGVVTGSTTLQLTRYTTGPAPEPTGDPVDVPLTFAGTGVSGIAIVSRSLDFGGVPVGTQGPGQRVEVSNRSPVTLQVQVAGGGPSSSDFGAGTACGGQFVTLAAGASCYIEYSGQPRSTGPVTGTTTLQTTMYSGGAPLSGSVVSVPLRFTAAGVQPFTVSATSLAFGDVAEGASSADQQVLVRNTSGVTASVQVAGGAPDTAEFTAGTACGGTFVTLAAGATCYVAYGFAPTRYGPVTGSTTLQLTNYTAAGDATAVVVPHPLTFTGTGRGSAPRVAVSPLAFDFGPAVEGDAASPLTSTVTNDGTGTATGLAVTPPSGAFAASSTCGSSLAAGASCTVTWRFAPTAVGPTTGSAVVASSGGRATVALTGRGIAAGPDPTVTVTSTVTTTVTATSTSTVTATATVTSTVTSTTTVTATSTVTVTGPTSTVTVTGPTATVTSTGSATSTDPSGPGGGGGGIDAGGGSGNRPAADDPTGLALTGAAVGSLGVLGAAAVVLGAAALLLARRRRTH